MHFDYKWKFVAQPINLFSFQYKLWNANSVLWHPCCDTQACMRRQKGWWWYFPWTLGSIVQWKSSIYSNQFDPWYLCRNVLNKFCGHSSACRVDTYQPDGWPKCPWARQRTPHCHWYVHWCVITALHAVYLVRIRNSQRDLRKICEMTTTFSTLHYNASSKLIGGFVRVDTQIFFLCGTRNCPLKLV